MNADPSDTYDHVAEEFCPEACGNLRAGVGIARVHTETCQAIAIAAAYRKLGDERDAKWRRYVYLVSEQIKMMWGLHVMRDEQIAEGVALGRELGLEP